MSQRDIGSEATNGGAGWRARSEEHADEVAAGRIWAAHQVCSEVAPLQAVLLADPGEELRGLGDPEEQLMLGAVDLGRLRSQTDAIEAFFASRGVVVHRWRPPVAPPPNWIFQRDLFFMTPEGAVLARPAAPQRAGEERFVQAELANLGVPIRASLRGGATFEGADALWLDPRCVLVGVGRRTNRAGFEAVATELRAQGVEALQVPVPLGVQHLLGLVNFIDRDLAAVHGGLAPVELTELLERRGIELLRAPPGEELSLFRGMNFVTLAPREVVMPTRAPRFRAAMEARGTHCWELDVSEYLQAAGGLACLTGILARER